LTRPSAPLSDTDIIGFMPEAHIDDWVTCKWTCK